MQTEKYLVFQKMKFQVSIKSMYYNVKNMKDRRDKYIKFISSNRNLIENNKFCNYNKINYNNIITGF